MNHFPISDYYLSKSIAIFHSNDDLFTQYLFLNEKRCNLMTFSWRLESESTRVRGKRNHKFCAIVTMIGNILVIISVFTYTPLKITPNYFIVSLAMADLTVSACVLPFNIVHSVLGRWVSSLKVDSYFGFFKSLADIYSFLR